jgi:hypothetical protein
VLFFGRVATAASDNILNAAQSTASGGTFDDLTGSAVTATADNEVVWLDIYRPGARFVRPEWDRATATILGDIYAIQYGPRTLGVDNDTAGTISGELHISPATGTA